MTRLALRAMSTSSLVSPESLALNMLRSSDLTGRIGPMTILPLRRLYIERQIQPEMLSFVSTEEVVALFKM